MEGAVRLRNALGASLNAIESVLATVDQSSAGTRLHNVAGLARVLAADGCIGKVAGSATDGSPKPVRAILFNKSPDANCALGWHQDRTICVRAKRDVPGFGPWTIKHGLLHVSPPFDLIERMVTLRVHLDDVPVTNAPLLVAPGSHRLGKVPSEQVATAVERSGVRACIATRGDIWLYATSILHASDRAQTPRNRRVLQVDYAVDDLPGGLAWTGV